VMPRYEDVGNKKNAEGGTRTPTSVRTLRPERSASTSFTTSASDKRQYLVSQLKQQYTGTAIYKYTLTTGTRKQFSPPPTTIGCFYRRLMKNLVVPRNHN
jgi:hypothetical protein